MISVVKGIFFWSTDFNFRKIEFSGPTKQPHFRKSISGSDFHPKQTQPKCQGFGHMAAQCPNKTLLIEELDGEEEVEEVVYEPNIEDIVEIGEDDSTQLACIRALPYFDNLSEGSPDTPVTRDRKSVV